MSRAHGEIRLRTSEISTFGQSEMFALRANVMVKMLTHFIDYIIDKTANKCEISRFHVFQICVFI